jgi:hypothetical protein
MTFIVPHRVYGGDLERLTMRKVQKLSNNIQKNSGFSGIFCFYCNFAGYLLGRSANFFSNIKTRHLNMRHAGKRLDAVKLAFRPEFGA